MQTAEQQAVRTPRARRRSRQLCLSEGGCTHTEAGDDESEFSSSNVRSEHGLQNSKPQLRQWCRLRRTLNEALQRPHRPVDSSRSHICSSCLRGDAEARFFCCRSDSTAASAVRAELRGRPVNTRFFFWRRTAHSGGSGSAAGSMMKVSAS